jgi:hypothetical protein
MRTMSREVWLFAGFALSGAVQSGEPAAPNAQPPGTIEAILGKFAGMGSLAPGQ